MGNIMAIFIYYLLDPTTKFIGMRIRGLVPFSVLLLSALLLLQSTAAEPAEAPLQPQTPASNTTATTRPALRGTNTTTATNDTIMEVTAAVDHQLTSVQSFINTYQQGTRFNDTTLTGVSGPLPPGVGPSIEQGQAGTLGPGVVTTGGAGTGTQAIAGGGVVPGVVGQPGTGSGGVGIGGSSTGAGTTAGSFGNAPGGAGFIGPS